MKYLHMLIVASSLVAVPGIAQSAGKVPVVTDTTEAPAVTPVVVKPNATIVSVDGRRIGRVDHVRSVNGTPMYASVVFAGQFVNVPVATLSAKDGGFVSSLKAADIIKR